jgi:Tfp pilus assembly protein PilV
MTGMGRTLPARTRGLSMLEMIFAVTLFATIVVALMGVWAMHARAVGRARNTLLASHLGEKVMETCLAQGWQVQPVAPSDSTTIEMTCLINDQTVITDFQYSVEVNDLGDGSDVGLKQVVVRVDWTEPDGQKREVHLETVVFWQG